MIASRDKDQPAKAVRYPVSPDVVVYGAGVAGVRAALSLAGLGHAVTLAFPETEPLADATARAARFVEATAAPADAGTLSQLHETLLRTPQIALRPACELTALAGEVGSYRVTLRAGAADDTLTAGALLLAGGDSEPLPTEALPLAPPHGQTLDSLLRALTASEEVPARLALIADLDAEQGRLVTTLFLCAARQTRLRGGRRVRVYCRSVRTGGTLIESLYRAARSVGVEFLRYARPPQYAVDGDAVTVTAEDTQLGRAVAETFDRVVFADHVPSPRNRRLAGLARIRQTAGRNAFSDNVWLLPCESSRRGIFVAGAGGANTDFNELATEAETAAHSIHALLAKGRIELPDDAARVEKEKCVACLTCVRLCPHGAIAFSTADGAAAVSPVMCQRCGVCAAECPADAIGLPGYGRDDIRPRFAARPRLVCFACANSATQAAEAARTQGLLDGTDLHVVEVPCAGTVDPRDVLHAFEQGADRVLVLSCNPDSCRYLDGASRAQRRVTRIRDLLQKSGISPDRLFWGGLTAAESRRLAAFVTGKAMSYSTGGSPAAAVAQPLA